MTAYKLRFHAQALKEWQLLDASVREPLKKKLTERLISPHVPAAALQGMADCYKIKLHSVGYRLAYRVDGAQMDVTVIAPDRRDKSKTANTAAQHT